MSPRRSEIAILLRAGHSVSEVMELTKVCRKTVFNVKKRLRDGDDLCDRPRSGRPSKLKPDDVKAAFKKNPKMKMTVLAKKKKVSVATVSRAVKKAGGKSLRHVKRPLLSQKHRETRLKRCKLLLNSIKHNGNRIVIFSDEKTFTVDPVINNQNDRVVCFDKSEYGIRNVTTTKHPASVMMLGVVASNGEKMPPVWFPVGYRLTGADYLEILKTKVKP